MKAKSNFSQLVHETTAKGAVGLFAGITIFIGAFVLWSASGVVGAIVSYLG